MVYAALKMIHVTCVVLSGAGFVWRGVRRLQGRAPLRSVALRVLPHLIDTVLLVSALAMVLIARWNPLVQPWLMVKISVLILYIGLGAYALKYGRTSLVRRFSFFVACVVFVYIVLVATTRSPWVGFF